MNHGIEVHLSANIEKYKQGMESAKKIGSDSLGAIAATFEKIKSALGGMWDSFKSFFSNMDKTKDKMGEVEDKSTGLATKIGIGLVAAFVAATAVIAAFVKKGLEADAALAKLAISSDSSVASFSRFESVAARSGMSVTEFGATMSSLHDEMKKAAAADDAGIFDKLGVKIVDANNALRQTDEVTIEVAKKIAAMSSEAEKYDAAAKVGFAGKVQLLEDIAHASTLAATTTDEQAAATVRLGKIWHEILPSGKSMWQEIADAITTSLTPAMTEASLSVLKSENTITDAFNKIFSSEAMFPKLSATIKEWSLDVSKWFSNVSNSATTATISLMKFLAEKTGMGDPNAYVLGSTPPGFVPPVPVLTSGKNASVVKDSVKKQIEEYDALTKVIKEKIEVQKQEIQTGEALTDGQKMAIKMATGLRDGTLQMTDAQKAERTEMFNTLITQEKLSAQIKESKAAAAAAAKKEAEGYATLIAAIRTKTAENQLELAYGDANTESAKMRIKMDQELASGKHALTAAHLAVARAALNEQEATEKLLLTLKTEKQVTELVTQSAIARNEAKDQLASEYALYGKSNNAREIALVAIKSEAQMQKELESVRKAGGPITDDIINQLKNERDIRTEVGQATMAQGKALAYANQLKDENKKFGIDYILDDKARAAASLQIDADMWQERIKLAGDGTEAQKLLQGEYLTWYQNQLLKPQLDADKAMWTSIESTAHDTFISIFDSGKSAFNRLRDTLKNGLLDLLYQMTIKKWILNIGASVGMTGATGMAQAASAAGGVGNGLSAVSGMSGALNFGGSAIAGVGNFVGSSSLSAFGAGFAGNSAGMATTAAETFANAGMAMESSAASLGATFAAAAPYLAAAMAVYAIWKSQDTSGTYHAGGASSADASGVTTIRAESLHFEATQVNAQTEKMTAALASGIVNILDSTATAFGKTAGYTAATAFADDTSKDGAWGGLVISKLGAKILDWQDTKTGAWAPKVFADGDAGKAEYLAALSTSLRTALDGIGLPAWAQTMLDKVGTGASIEELGKVVDSINATQHALVIMGDKLQGFAGMSEGAVSALIAASGGIDALTSSAGAYYDKFYTDAEKAAGATKLMSDALTAAGLSVPANIVAYRAEVEAQMALGEAGAANVAILLKNAGAFAALNPALEAVAASTQSATDALAAAEAIRKEQHGLDIQLMTAMGNAEGALVATRKDSLAAMLSDQARLTQQQIWAADEAAAATAKAQESAKAMQAAVATQQAAAAAATQSFGNALVGAMNGATAAAKALRAFNDSLLLGNLSPLSKGAQYDVAKQAFATNGDQASATAFLQASQARGGSKLDYARDFAMVIASNSKMAAANDATAAAIPSVWAAFRSMQADGSHAGGLNYVPFDGYRAILHKGESVKTAAETRAMQSGGSGMSDATAQRLIAAIEEGNKHARKTADTLERVTKGGKSLLTTAAA